MAEAASADESSIAFKGRMLTLTVLEIRVDDVERIRADAAEQTARAPEFFARLPILLSITGPRPDLARVCEELRALNLFVAGVVEADEDTARAAVAAGLGVARTATAGGGNDTSSGEKGRTRDRPDTASRNGEGRNGNGETKGGAARIVDRPVRSGQQIYARGGDLVVLDSISSGAEVIADGHIHVYGTLRGRALAGAAGDTSARIFCRRFEPDLIAIAGCYKVADAIESEAYRRAVSVRLEADNLHIETEE